MAGSPQHKCLATNGNNGRAGHKRPHAENVLTLAQMDSRAGRTICGSGATSSVAAGTSICATRLTQNTSLINHKRKTLAIETSFRFAHTTLSLKTQNPGH